MYPPIDDEPLDPGATLRDPLSEFNHLGLKDPVVYDLASKLNRLIITFNGDDFKKMVDQSTDTGVINISANLRSEQIDTKLTSLLTKSGRSAFFGNFTDLTGETDG